MDTATDLDALDQLAALDVGRLRQEYDRWCARLEVLRLLLVARERDERRRRKVAGTEKEVAAGR